MSGSNCPRCGSGSVSVSETKTQVTHTCNSCGYSETQTKAGRAERIGRAYAAGLLVMLALCTVFIIWGGAPA